MGTIAGVSTGVLAQDRRSKRRNATVVLVGAGLVAGMNTSFINLALADIARDLDASTADLQWILNAYVLMFIGVMFAATRLGDAFGQSRALKVSLVTFGIGSAGAMVATTASLLIFWRAVMGASVALSAPTSLALVSAMYPEARERARVLGIWTGAAACGLAVGPLVGGVLLDRFWWGSVFAINLPVIFVISVGVHLWVPASKATKVGGFDLRGMALSVAGLSSVIWAIIEAPHRGWTDPVTMAAFGVGACLIVVFVRWERRAAFPILEIDRLRVPRVAVSMASMCFGTAAFGGLALISSIMLRTMFGYGPLKTGLAVAPLAVGMVTTSLISRRVARGVGNYATIGVGLLSIAGSALLLVMLTHDTGYPHVMLALALLGGGYGLASPASIGLIMGGMPASHAGMASAVSYETRNVGQSFGVAVIGSLLSVGYRSRLVDPQGQLTAEQLGRARGSIAGALAVADGLVGDRASRLRDDAESAFAHGTRLAALGAMACALLGAFTAFGALAKIGAASQETQIVVNASVDDSRASS